MFFTLEYLIYAALSIIFAPGFLLYLLVIVMAAFGKSSGITKLYTKIMLLIFEWGKHRIEIHNKALENNNKSNNDDHGNDNQNDDDNQDVAPAYRHPKIEFRRSIEDLHGAFTLADIMYFCRSGIKVIVDDEVTQRFDAAATFISVQQFHFCYLSTFLAGGYLFVFEPELPSWNLLTRTNNHYEFISWRLSILWGLGCILRLCILFPFRLILALISLTCFFIGTALIGGIKDEKSRRKYYCWLSLAIFRMMSRSFSSVITYHNRENRAKGGGICVANHTSPIDIIILGCDNCYAMVGQIQGGLFGSVQNAMSKAEHQVWFQRTEMKDRLSVTKRLKDHVEDKSLLPILIFPEGTCINNTSIMMFKKGSFEVGGTIYPVAIKYDSRFADPFWNSSKETLTRHLINILTSWALVADVWYLPPQTQQPGETAIEFTNRVKSLIAKQGGLVDLDWDGQLKREKPKPALMKKKQEEYSRRLLNME